MSDVTEDQTFSIVMDATLSEQADSSDELSEAVTADLSLEDISNILDSIGLTKSVSIVLSGVAAINEALSSTRALVIVGSEIARALNSGSFGKTQGLSTSDAERAVDSIALDRATALTMSVLARVIQSLSAGRSSSIVPSSVVNVPKSLAIASGHTLTLTDGRLYSDDVSLLKTIGLSNAYVYGARASIQIGKSETISVGEVISALVSSGLSRTMVISPSMNGDYTLSVLFDKTASVDFVPGTILYVFTTPKARVYMVLPENRSMVADEL